MRRVLLVLALVGIGLSIGYPTGFIDGQNIKAPYIRAIEHNLADAEMRAEMYRRQAESLKESNGRIAEQLDRCQAWHIDRDRLNR